jgi:glycosyltransferase involved in cell wall biosynthesis
LIIAGGSAATDEYVDLLKEKAGGNERIVFTGYVKGKEKEELLSNAKVFVIPSSLEGLPIALLETMSYGLICLASDIEPHKEVLVDGVNGFLFNHNTPNDLKEALFRILSLSEADLCSIKINAKKHVEKEYNWDEVVERTEEVYQELVC